MGLDVVRRGEESNHLKVVGPFPVSGRRGPYTVLMPAKKFYPQEQPPIAAVDYTLGFVEDLYLVLGDFARDGSQATVKVQVNRMVSWIWIGGPLRPRGAPPANVPAGEETGGTGRRAGSPRRARPRRPPPPPPRA